jgi:hypothetical protein
VVIVFYQPQQPPRRWFANIRCITGGWKTAFQFGYFGQVLIFSKRNLIIFRPFAFGTKLTNLNTNPKYLLKKNTNPKPKN